MNIMNYMTKYVMVNILMIKKLARQIAEENYNCTGNEKGINLMAMEYESVLSRIAQDYCIVPKSKIDALQAEIFKEVMDAHDADDWQGVAHYILDVMPRSFSKLF